MTSTKYTYQCTADLSRLTEEIRSSNITVALDYIYSPLPGTIDCWFKDILSQEEQSILSDIISNHVPTPLPDETVLNVKVLDTPRQFLTDAANKLIVTATPQPGLVSDVSLSSRTDSCADNPGDMIQIDHTVFQPDQDIQSIYNSCGLFVDNGGNYNLSKYWLNTKYLDFHTVGNRTFMVDGGFAWQGLNEYNGILAISLQAVTSVIDMSLYETTPGEGNVVIVDNYIVVPMPGLTGGTHNLPLGQVEEETLQTGITCATPIVLTGKYWYPTFWSIDYNLVTCKFFNLLPDENPYSEYKTATLPSSTIRLWGNLFAVEIPLMTLIRDFLVIGNSNNFFNLGSSEVSEIGHGIRLRVDCKTLTFGSHINCPWSLVGYIKTYRESTV